MALMGGGVDEHALERRFACEARQLRGQLAPESNASRASFGNVAIVLAVAAQPRVNETRRSRNTSRKSFVGGLVDDALAFARVDLDPPAAHAVDEDALDALVATYLVEQVHVVGEEHLDEAVGVVGLVVPLRGLRRAPTKT